MKLKELKDLIKDLPDDMNVCINYHTWDNLSWVVETIDSATPSPKNNTLYLCGEEKDNYEL